MLNPYQQYKEQSLSTLAPGEVLVKLFDECIKQLLVAKLQIEQKDYAKVNDALTKTQSILSTLSSSLDMRFPVSSNLKELYNFMISHILQANIKKDTAKIDDCISLIKDLRDSFFEAEKINRKANANTGTVGGRAV